MTAQTYIRQFVSEVNKVTSITPLMFCYGENIDNGSRLTGLTRGLQVHASGRIKNVGNCELAHCGIGFGMMLNGIPTVLFAKQLDFMLLGVDHFVSTYNLVRSQYAEQNIGSFSLITIVCDQGLQGPQSSFNALGDICSLAQVPGYTLNTAAEMQEILSAELVRPGFRLICLSQSRFASEVNQSTPLDISKDKAVFKYRAGDQATIVALNFGLDHSLKLQTDLMNHGIGSDVYSLQYVPEADISLIESSVARTGCLIVIDDSKSTNSWSGKLVNELLHQGLRFRTQTVERVRPAKYGVDPEIFEVDSARVLEWIKSSS